MKPDESSKSEPEQAEPIDPITQVGAEDQAGGEDSGAFPIVGIGASAGGLTAFEQLFSNLPAETGMAFVVVQHLTPHKSILPEIIQRYTAMPVFQVTDGIEVKPNCVYVIPPNNNLNLIDGRLILLKPPADRGYRFPIDFFFRSLAESRKSQAIGIILSGSASDGSLGIKSIKAEGGLTIAQIPDTAEFADMPRNAIATQDIDFVLPPDQIGPFILRYINHQIIIEQRETEPTDLHAMGALQKLYYLLRTKTGHDFSLYKQNTLLRRIDRRMKIALVPDLEAYIQYAQRHPEEIEALFREMLINVTQFFRDPDAFQALVQKVIRPLITLKYASQAPIRVWIAGCSSGEEAYSIAILFQEQFEAMAVDCKLQIYATDLDLEAITVARRGVYVDGALDNVSSERLKRFFSKEEDGYHIKKSIRDAVVFSNQNLIFDPPFSKIDLLCCRNVLIYLESELQKQLFPLFHYALNPGGFLFLGNSETVGGFHDLFGIVDRKYKIYQSKDVLIRHKIQTRTQPAMQPAALPPSDDGVRPTPLNGLREWTERELLKYHTPACVIIDDKNNILYIHGRTGKYLEPTPGEVSSNLIRMAREGLKAELATAVHTVTITQKTITRQNIRVKTNGDYQLMNLTVRPVNWEDHETSLCMVVFEELRYEPVEGSPTGGDETGKSQQVADLERALREKDEYLTSIINELEDTNQELKSTNEELLSSNEEMQSSNEELETSREELQSINEELSTVNAEMQNKNAELTLLNNDVYNLLASTEIGTIFLDLDLQLRRFTPAIQRVYSFLPADIGRSLAHFHSNLKYDHLLEDIQQVLATLSPKAIEAQTSDGIWYLVNIQPYRTLENVIDGVVITFVDITKQKQRDEQRRLEILLRDANDAITVQDFSGNIQAWNPAAIHMYGWTEAEALTMNMMDMTPEYLREGMRDVYRRLSKGERVRSYETKRLTRNGRVIDVWITPSIISDYDNRPMGITTTERDITDRKQTEQLLHFENRSLKVLKDWYQSTDQPAHAAAQFPSICQILVETGGYRLAWMGKVSQDAKITISIVDWAGGDGGASTPPPSLQSLVRRSQKLAETVLQTRRPVLVRNILTDPTQRPWRAEASKYSFQSYVFLPLIHEKDPLGVLVIFAEEPDAFIDPEMENLELLSAEISLKLSIAQNGTESS